MRRLTTFVRATVTGMCLAAAGIALFGLGKGEFPTPTEIAIVGVVVALVTFAPYPGDDDGERAAANG